MDIKLNLKDKKAEKKRLEDLYSRADNLAHRYARVKLQVRALEDPTFSYMGPCPAGWPGVIDEAAIERRMPGPRAISAISVRIRQLTDPTYGVIGPCDTGEKYTLEQELERSEHGVKGIEQQLREYKQSLGPAGCPAGPAGEPGPHGVR